MSDPSNMSGLSRLPNNDSGLFALPIRGEKRFISIPTTIDATLVNLDASGATVADFSITAAEEPEWEYCLIRIPGRGYNSNGVPDPSVAAYFQFLINPSTVQVNHSTVDSQTLAKAGWQFGVWGGDFSTITLEGKTPGKYFSLGLTDYYTQYTLSYRNLEALEVFFENNGYWFEGEQVFTNTLNNNVHRQIKMHSDVELTVGEFIWNGMFESMTVSEDSDSPFLSTFSLTFIAWNERYNENSTARSPIGGAVQRGHVPTPIKPTPTDVEPTPVSTTATIPLTPNLPAYSFSSVQGIMNPEGAFGS